MTNNGTSHGDKPLLAVENVTKAYGSVVALDDVSFRYDEGEGITAIIGPNGAGKTTLYDVITGKRSPDAGHIQFDGKGVTNTSIHERAADGLGRSFQVTNIYEGLTVRQNIRIPLFATSDHRFDMISSVEDNDVINDEVDRLLAMLDLEDEQENICEELPYGARRRVELGATLALDPKLMLLDEPTAGMTPKETADMVALIEEVDEETDTSFIITEHKMNIVFSMASRIIVLHYGKVLTAGTPSEIRSDEDVQSAYLGTESRGEQTVEDQVATSASQNRDVRPILEIEDIHTYYGQSHILQGVSFDVYAGEIVGLIGRNGAGKTTTIRSINGFTPPRSGKIRFEDTRLDDKQPFAIAAEGIAVVPEKRRTFTDLTVDENVSLAMDPEDGMSFEEIYDIFPQLEQYAESKGSQLSGGEQQMLAIARALAPKPDLLVLDEPSEGLAPVIVETLSETLADISEIGITILIAEQNIDFSLQLCDRVYILSDGQVEWEGTSSELLENQYIIDSYLSLSKVSEGSSR